MDASSYLNVSEDDFSSSSRAESRVKKGNMRSKIFSTGREKSEDSAPRFVYNRVEQDGAYRINNANLENTD